MRGEVDDGVREGEGDLDILILDSGISQVQARLHLPDFIVEDAITLSRIVFDTAPYRLVSGRIAFGVRKSVANNSRVNPFSQTTLRLYDLEADKLRLIAGDIVVEESHGEWDGNCAGEFWKASRTLSIAPDRHNGAADIVITSREKNRITEQKDEMCHDDEKNESTLTHRLKYDGRIYTVPKALKP
ncbi:MAG: hypothetical protein QM636_09275 [Rhizobium sp.]